ncbi:MAG: hypothetical protein EXS48_02890 [Candidatus Staskawiczbacteria bacterium]|nr:hypothetical protein [Candidatus Staskawiczbacteria bacterium]
MDINEEKNKDLYKEAQELAKKEGVEDVVELEGFSDKEQSVAPSDEHEKIKAQIENMVLGDDAKIQVQTHSNDFQSLEATGKIEKLLQLTKQKGVIFAVAVAKKMNDPYVLDTLHDTLAKEGYYKEFIK